jgi:thiol-disulfide isomerase/thioredoxin
MDRDRRRLVGTLAMTMAATRLGVADRLQAARAPAIQRLPRELAAIVRAAQWLNSPPLTPSHFTGHVVLVGFWTYTCINWRRTLPYLRAWTQKYREGLVVIGVHTPEFTFERSIDNVRGAVRQMGIEYPIAIDNDRAIWRAFKNQYWPALYFVDARGHIRQHHFGEGKYEQSELVIQQLLQEAGAVNVPGGHAFVAASGPEVPADWNNMRSAERSLGHEQTENFASAGGVHPNRRRLYAAPARMWLNDWALAGEWTMGKEATALHSSSGRILYGFHARDLHLVMGPARQESPIRFRVSIDGQRPGNARGVDVDEGGNGVVVDHRLYHLIRQPTPIEDRLFEIEFLQPGIEAFAFSFG